MHWCNKSVNSLLHSEFNNKAMQFHLYGLNLVTFETFFMPRYFCLIHQNNIKVKEKPSLLEVKS